MRLDKFLKVSMIIKRRVIAKELADAGKISINGKTAKPNSEVIVNDIIAVKLPSKVVNAKVISTDERDFFKGSMIEIIE